jgi:hypothetical protein
MELARFYAGLLGGTPQAEDDEWVVLEGAGFRLAFQRVTDLREPRWPDPERPQQFHLDITVEDPDTAQEQVLALGARLLEDDHDGKRNWRVFADPVGHPFCLCFS